MMMRGDMQKLIDQINPILEGYNKRIEVLEEALKSKKSAPKGVTKLKKRDIIELNLSIT